MVNLVQVAKQQLVHRLATRAGLRPHAVDVDDAGTVISVWVPKHKLLASDGEQRRKDGQKSCRLSIVLLHGFAGDGIMTWMFQAVTDAVMRRAFYCLYFDVLVCNSMMPCSIQVGALAKRYDVYVPDMLFFGGSTSPAPGRSPDFQAECVVAALRRLGVERCAVVGFSYGGFVAFRMAEAHPGLVRSVVATGTLAAMNGSTSAAMLWRLGAASWAEILLPDDVTELRSLFAAGTHGKWWFPDRVLNDYLDLFMFNRKERAELLEGMVISGEDAAVPCFRQDILLLWGEGDKIFDMELAKSLKEQLGEKATLRSISKAGHLAQLERPRVFNRCLLEFLRRGEAAGAYDDGDVDVNVNVNGDQLVSS